MRIPDPNPDGIPRTRTSLEGSQEEHFLRRSPLFIRVMDTPRERRQRIRWSRSTRSTRSKSRSRRQSSTSRGRGRCATTPSSAVADHEPRVLFRHRSGSRSSTRYSRTNMGTDDRSHDPPRRGTKTLSVHVSLNAVLRLVNTLLWAVLCFVAVREAMWLSPPSVTPSTSSMFSYTGVDTTSAHVPNSDGLAEHPHDTDHPDHLPMHGVYSPHAMYAAAAQYHHYCSAGLVLVAGYLDVLPPFLNLGLLLLVGLLMGTMTYSYIVLRPPVHARMSLFSYTPCTCGGH